MYLDILITGGKIITLDPNKPEAAAVGIKDDTIALVEDSAQSLHEAMPVAKHIDLRGAVLLPGFIDTHVHLLNTGIYQLLGVDCTVALTIAEVLEHISNKANAIHTGDWILGYGFDHEKIKERRYPTANELSEAAPYNPVFVQRRDGHSAALNWEAIKLFKISAGQPGVDTDESGRAIGVVRGMANTKVIEKLNRILVTPSLCERAYSTAALEALKVGLTTVHALVGGKQTDLSTSWLIENGLTLPVRTVVYDETTDVDRVKAEGLNRIGGCLLIDGSVGSWTAALYEPYSDNPSSSGVLYWDDDCLFQFIHKAHQEGLQVSMHAIGERAIDQLLSAYEKAIKKSPRWDHRHRVEHFLFPTWEAVDKAAELGLVLAMQPAFEYFWGGVGNMYGSRLGPERVTRTKPIRTALQKGIRVAGGSDSYVTPMWPLLGIHAAVNHPNDAQRISVLQAIELFTTNAAYAAFEEDKKGMIKRGYLADFVILAEDPRVIPSAKIKDISVLMTIVGGKLVYSACHFG